MKNKDMGKIAFVGDSILHGWGVRSAAACWRVFEKLTGLGVVSQGGINPMAQPGATLSDLVARTPCHVARYRPDLVFVSAGANHYEGDGRLVWPYGMNEEELMGLFLELFSGLHRAGCRCVWLGFPAFEACGSLQEKPLMLSRKVEKICKDFLLDSRFFLEEMRADASWDAMGGRFYDNLAMDVHPNAEGQRLIAECCADWIGKI
jgi:lysophospholipase L1-like esterase